MVGGFAEGSKRWNHQDEHADRGSRPIDTMGKETMHASTPLFTQSKLRNEKSTVWEDATLRARSSGQRDCRRIARCRCGTSQNRSRRATPPSTRQQQLQRDRFSHQLSVPSAATTASCTARRTTHIASARPPPTAQRALHSRRRSVQHDST